MDRGTHKQIVTSFETNLARMKGVRDELNSIFDDINTYVLLSTASFIDNITSPSERKDDEIYDSIGIQSHRQLTSILSSLVDPSKPWFKFVFKDTSFNEDESMKIWLEEQVNPIMLDTFLNSASGFYSSIAQFFGSAASYGTSVLWMADEKDGGIKFNNRHLTECYIDEDHNGVGDTLYREFMFTARQSVQAGWEEELGDTVKKALKSDPMRKFKFLHAVMPKADFIRSAGEHLIPPMHRDKPFIGVYLGLEDKRVLEVEGYFESPFVIYRFEKMTGEVYGRSSSWNAMSDILMANAIKEILLRAGEKNLDPQMLTPYEGVIPPSDNAPGGQIPGGMSEEGRELVRPYNPNVNPQLSEHLLEQARDMVRKHFFVDHLMDREGKQPLTATEVNQIAENKLRVLGPQVRRAEDEALSPIIRRVLSIHRRNRTIPDAPTDKKVELNIEFTSPLAFTQRSAQLLAYNRFMANVGPLVERDPAAFENFDFDKIVRAGAELAGIPLSELVPVEELEADRDAEAQMMKQEQDMAQAVQGVDAAAKLQKSGIPIVPGV